MSSGKNMIQNSTYCVPDFGLRSYASKHQNVSIRIHVLTLTNGTRQFDTVTLTDTVPLITGIDVPVTNIFYNNPTKFLGASTLLLNAVTLQSFICSQVICSSNDKVEFVTTYPETELKHCCSRC